ncbi:MAG: divalent cation tolerance protein CutA [Opitutaceae bacterium]|nr:divalent cation tolerance protein CutA [Cytophagales bacterium]
MNKENEAKALINDLLTAELVANASLHIKNVIYRIDRGVLVANSHVVITAQTRAVLFSEIQGYIKKLHGEHVPLYSLPITQANDSFDALIRNHTKKILV